MLLILAFCLFLIFVFLFWLLFALAQFNYVKGETALKTIKSIEKCFEIWDNWTRWVVKSVFKVVSVSLLFGVCFVLLLQRCRFRMAFYGNDIGGGNSSGCTHTSHYWLQRGVLFFFFCFINNITYIIYLFWLLAWLKEQHTVGVGTITNLLAKPVCVCVCSRLSTVELTVSNVLYSVSL